MKGLGHSAPHTLLFSAQHRIPVNIPRLSPRDSHHPLMHEEPEYPHAFRAQGCTPWPCVVPRTSPHYILLYNSSNLDEFAQATSVLELVAYIRIKDVRNLRDPSMHQSCLQECEREARKVLWEDAQIVSHSCSSTSIVLGIHLTPDLSRWGDDGCILCRRAKKFGDSKFCHACDISMKTLGPILVPVPGDNETYENGGSWLFVSEVEVRLTIPD